MVWSGWLGNQPEQMSDGLQNWFRTMSVHNSAEIDLIHFDTTFVVPIYILVKLINIRSKILFETGRLINVEATVFNMI